jgi:hypothetical protein
MTMISASFQGRNVMRCISTFAVMGASDPKLAASRRRFAEYLEETGCMAAGTDPASLWANSSWAYRCSIPRRQDDGAILYVHVF